MIYFIKAREKSEVIDLSVDKILSTIYYENPLPKKGPASQGYFPLNHSPLHAGGKRVMNHVWIKCIGIN